MHFEPPLDAFTQKTIISATVQHRDNYYHFAPHLHTSFEIYEILSGQCSMETSHGIITAKPGDFVLIMPNTLHSFFLDTEEPCCFYHIHFHQDSLSVLPVSESFGTKTDLPTMLILSNPFYCKLKATPKIHLLVSQIVDDMSNCSRFSNVYSNFHLIELLLRLWELTGNHELTSPSNLAKNNYVSFTLSFIRKNYSHKIRIHDISSSLNISDRYLSKIFYKNMHLTISNYINIYRLNHAVDFMLHTEMNLTEIALAIGLNDSQHFSRIFKQIMGISPLKYRKLLREGSERSYHMAKP